MITKWMNKKFFGDNMVEIIMYEYYNICYN